MESNKEFSPIFTELLLRGKKLDILYYNLISKTKFHTLFYHENS